MHYLVLKSITPNSNYGQSKRGFKMAKFSLDHAWAVGKSKLTNFSRYMDLSISLVHDPTKNKNHDIRSILDYS